MAYKPMFGSRHRERLWLRECFNAYAEGRTDGSCPVCNLCDQPVTRAQADADGWHESHNPSRAKSFGGKSVGVAHVSCNLEHGRTVVVPALAKSNRVRKAATRRTFAGSGRYPMRAGYRSAVTKTMGRGLRPRLTLAQKHAATMAARAIVPPELTSPPTAEL